LVPFRHGEAKEIRGVIVFFTLGGASERRWLRSAIDWAARLSPRYAIRWRNVFGPRPPIKDVAKPCDYANSAAFITNIAESDFRHAQPFETTG
jgi:hypothetical protein